MIVTETTKYKDFTAAEKYLTEEAVADLKKAAERAYVGMYELTFGQFLQISGGDFAAVLGDMSDPTVLQVYWAKRFADFQKEYGEALKNTQVPMTAEQKRASDGLPKTTFAECMLTFGRSYFGLHNFREAEKLTLGDLIIARRDAYNSAMFERRLQRIQMEKYRKKK